MNLAKIAQVAGGKIKGIATAIQGLTKTQAIIAGVATVTAVGGVGTGGVLMYQHFNEPQIVAEVIVSTEAPSEEEIVAIEAVVTEETEAAEPTTVNLVGSSIEKDLKIKIQDPDANNIKGQPFEITVTADKKNAKATTYEDDDQDGIIYIKSIDAGNYEVALSEIDGYISSETKYSVTVKDKIEYKKVDVADEIKKESEVAPAEDAQVDNVEVEGVLADTVELLDSTATPSVVGAADVDMSKFPKAAVAGSSSTNTFTQTARATSNKVSYSATGTEGTTTGGENGAASSEQKEKYGYTVKHYFDDELVSDKTVTFTKENGVVEGTEITAENYASDKYELKSGSTLKLVISATGDNILNVYWVTKKVAETNYTYTCTINYIKDDATTPFATDTLKEENTTLAEKEFDAANGTQYSTITSTYDVDATKTTTTKAKATSTEKDVVINIYVKTKVVVTKGEASVTIPQTASLYTSNINGANAIALTATVSDTIGIIKNIAWASSDEKIVKVSNGSKTGCTITSVAKGSAKITATVTYYTGAGVTTANATDSSATATVSAACTVTVSDFTSATTTRLMDKWGRGLYKDTACKTAAMVSDYTANGTYYTSPVYTGWQTLNGKVYYYNANHEPITGNQVISGISYTFGSDGALQQGSGKNGIDVSSHQGSIDWAAVKAAGISFAIIRVGYRGSQTGALVEDSYFKKNIQGATTNGIAVGTYFFTQAVTEAEAVEEASMALSLCSGYSLSYPIFVDTENGSGSARANGLDKASRTACVSAFCKTIANGGKKAGVYASKSWYNDKINASAFSSYFIWVAQYNTSCTYTGKYNMWQYSSKGSVPGIKGNVDVDIVY